MIEVAEELRSLPWKASTYNDQWDTELPRLLNAAFEARKLAYSYRTNPFLVGVSVLARKAIQSDRSEAEFMIFTGMNTKFDPNCPKWCGECYAITAAVHAGYEQIIGMAVVAENQQDNESGVLLDFLTPCGKCRSFFRKRRDMISSETRIIGVRIPDFYCSGMTVADLYLKHNEAPF
jgi:cytidine deaminase